MRLSGPSSRDAQQLEVPSRPVRCESTTRVVQLELVAPGGNQPQRELVGSAREVADHLFAPVDARQQRAPVLATKTGRVCAREPVAITAGESLDRGPEHGERAIPVLAAACRAGIEVGESTFMRIDVVRRHPHEPSVVVDLGEEQARLERDLVLAAEHPALRERESLAAYRSGPQLHPGAPAGQFDHHAERLHRVGVERREPAPVVVAVEIRREVCAECVPVAPREQLAEPVAARVQALAFTSSRS